MMTREQQIEFMKNAKERHEKLAERFKNAVTVMQDGSLHVDPEKLTSVMQEYRLTEQEIVEKMSK